MARLVTEGTIEEKVLTLHAKKRALYEDLVSGADGAGTLDVDALAALLDDVSPAELQVRAAQASTALTASVGGDGAA